MSYQKKVRIGGSATQAARTSDYGRIVTQGWGQVNVTDAITGFPCGLVVVIGRVERQTSAAESRKVDWANIGMTEAMPSRGRS